MNFNFRTSGFAQLEQRLKQLSREDATKAGQSANRAGAAVLKKAVEKEAPVSNVAEGTKITRHTKGGKTREETHHKIKNNVKIKKSKAPGGARRKLGPYRAGLPREHGGVWLDPQSTEPVHAACS